MKTPDELLRNADICLEAIEAGIHDGSIDAQCVMALAMTAQACVMLAKELREGAERTMSVTDAVKTTTTGTLDPFEEEDPFHPFPGSGYELNEEEFEGFYGMTVEEYYAELDRRSKGTGSSDGTS